MLKDRYLVFTLFLTALVAFCFLGKLFVSPNSSFFCQGGDGLQTYYQSIYHVKHDSTYLHQQGMNYPFGESIFYTGGQPMFSNFVKALQPVVDLSDYMVGITNLFMLFGILICPIFLYLIFKRFSVHPLYAALISVGLTFFTQQLERMGGHFPLAFIFAIPGMIYLLMRYYDSGKWKWSFIISLYLIFLVFAHIYYFAFFAVVAFSFWLVFIIFDRHRKVSFFKSIIHLSIQWILPLLLLQLCIRASSEVSDRTAIPWGFMVFRSGWSGFLFPYGMTYGNLFNFLKPNPAIEWEGLCYIGGSAVILLIIGVAVLIFRFKSILQTSTSWQNKALLALAISSILCVACSFAFPFNIGLENLLYKLGPIQQFRGIGRFAFVAFFPINLVLFILFWKIPFEKHNIKIGASFLLIALLYADAFSRISAISRTVKNDRKEVLSGIPNEISTRINADQFQAILPFPFFHVGSENISLEGDGDLKTLVYDLSIITGLPTFAASMSRTSISQSFKSVALAKEYLESPTIIEQLKDKRPLLLIADDSKLNKTQIQLVLLATELFKFEKFTFYQIPLDAFAKAHNIEKTSSSISIEQHKYEYSENISSTDSNAKFVYQEEAIQLEFGGNWKRYYEDSIPKDWQGKNISFSFWVKNFTRDLIPRTVVEIIQKNGDKIIDYNITRFGSNYVGLNNSDALVELIIPISADTKFLEISFENKELNGQIITIESMLLRDEKLNCVILHNKIKSLNNRIY